jgi:hypothetical protein
MDRESMSLKVRQYGETGIALHSRFALQNRRGKFHKSTTAAVTSVRTTLISIPFTELLRERKRRIMRREKVGDRAKKEFRWRSRWYLQVPGKRRYKKKSELEHYTQPVRKNANVRTGRPDTPYIPIALRDGSHRAQPALLLQPVPYNLSRCDSAKTARPPREAYK